MSEYLEFSLDIPIGLLARQISGSVPHPIVERFKEGLSSSKKINPLYFEEGIIELRAGELMQAYNMGCYARIWLESNSQMLLELLF
ncbi:hypothetical protein ACFL6S_22345 [Candidatus Poribacteria bacterium]